MIRDKIYFRLKVDEDGYPPYTTESLWGIKLKNGFYQIDNIPFYVYGIALGDIVEVDGAGYFSRLITPSGLCTLRVYSERKDSLNNIVEGLKDLEGECEYSNIPSLIAISIPQVNLPQCERIIKQEQRRDSSLAYEIATAI